MISRRQMQRSPVEFVGARFPILPRAFVVVLHVGYWSLYLLLLTIVVIGTRMTTPVPRFLFATSGGFLLIVPNFAAFYVEYFLLTPRLFPQKRFGLLAFLTVLTAFTTSALCALVLVLASRQGLALVRTPFVNPTAILAWLSVLALIHMTLAMVIRGFISWYEDIAVKEQLARKTSEVVVLYESRAERVPLAEELAYFDKYIALQRIRITNPKLVSYTLSASTDGWSIAPMLLIPLSRTRSSMPPGSAKTTLSSSDFRYNSRH